MLLLQNLKLWIYSLNAICIYIWKIFFVVTDIAVEDSWALPPNKEKISRLKANTALVDADFELKTYKRIVQIAEVKGHLLPVLLRCIEVGLPEGVSFSVVEHSELADVERYVPDKELLELKEQLTGMGGPSLAKKR